MIPLIIDTDVALGVHHEGRPRDIDDGFAIAEAINSPGIDLRLITAVFGNGPLPEVLRVANEITAIKGSNVPVAQGAEAAMQENDPGNAAVERLAAELTRAPANVAAIGPLTNIGLLAKHHPQAFERIEKLLIVAGRTAGNTFMLGGKGPVGDFNFENDPRAAEILLQAARNRVEVVMAGFELTSQVCVTERDLQHINARGSETARYFYDNSLAWCRHWTRSFPSDAGFHPWDSATISYLKHPEYFTTERRSWRIGQADDGTPLLETVPDVEGPVTYCTGFTLGGAEAFVADVVQTVY